VKGPMKGTRSMRWATIPKAAYSRQCCFTSCPAPARSSAAVSVRWQTLLHRESAQDRQPDAVALRTRSEEEQGGKGVQLRGGWG